MIVHNPNNLPTKPIADLLPTQGDLKDLTEVNYNKLKNVIERRGFSYPVYVWEDKNQILHLLDGHQRQRVLNRESWNDPIPYLKVPANDLQEAMARLLEITSQYATITQEGIDEFIATYELEEADVYEATSFDALGKYGDDEDPEIEEDNPPDFNETDPPISNPGEIYQLGRHRVMCGDSTDKTSVELLMDGVKADIGFTSPPYNAGDNVRGKFYANDDDNKTNDEYTIFLTDTSMITVDYCDYSFVNLQILEGNKLSLIDFQTNMRDYIKDILVWNKSIAPPHINKGTFATKWEYIFAFSKQSKSRAFPASWQGKYPNVIETENNSGNEFAKEHKAGFPVALPLWIINKMDFAKIVLDVFIGTGTTLIACEQTDRTCYGMELDPKYVDVIRKRYSKFTNNDELPDNWEELTPAINTGGKQVD
jgi:DNA modification methylase